MPTLITTQMLPPGRVRVYGSVEKSSEVIRDKKKKKVEKWGKRWWKKKIWKTYVKEWKECKDFRIDEREGK